MVVFTFYLVLASISFSQGTVATFYRCGG